MAVKYTYNEAGLIQWGWGAMHEYTCKMERVHELKALLTVPGQMSLNNA